MYQGSKARKNRPGKSMTISTSTQGSNSRSTSTTCSLNPELTSKRKSDSSFIPASPTEVYDTHELNNRDNEQPWTWDQPYRHDIPRAEDSDPWEICYELSKKYDDDLIGAWRDEVEHLLIFAGLFSAVVTAFAVESYKGLQSDPTESTIILLALIAAQLGANSTLIQPLSPTSGGSLPSPTTSLNVQLNVFHFLSLTLSISTVLIGILCLQWLREYDHDVGLPHKDSVGLRQMRFEGLLAWKVPNILSALPVILQLSLVLFFIGLLELLWSLDKVVAYLVTVVVGLTLLFLVITTVIPTFQYFFVHKSSLQVPQCPYKSPQSWAFHKLIRRIVWWHPRVVLGS
ncbi:hypothetical protein BDQ17DRAFT_989267 [Cyathus striatus]|nr:hypothetical protein BDQ17DRAFT_989267 [Cyathus striatus]